MSMPSRREVLLGTTSLAAGLAIAGCQVPTTNDAATQESEHTASDKADVSTSASADLPFSLSGVPCEGNVIQAARGET